MILLCPEILEFLCPEIFNISVLLFNKSLDIVKPELQRKSSSI